MSEEWKEINAFWKGGTDFIGTNAQGGRVVMGEVDGERGIAPMELLLASLAGCTGVDIALILKKKRAKLHDLQVRVRGKRAATHPRYYTEIEIEYLLWGEDLQEKDVTQAIQLSEEKYCSASAMLREKAEIRHTYQIFPPKQQESQS